MKNIHPTAIVNPDAKVGDNLFVGPYAVIESDVEIGDDCEIGPHAVLYSGARLGNRVKISQGASVSNLHDAPIQTLYQVSNQKDQVPALFLSFCQRAPF